MFLSSTEYEARKTQIQQAIEQLRNDLENLHIEMYGSEREYKKALLMEKYEVRTGYRVTTSSDSISPNKFKFIIVYKKNPAIQELKINRFSGSTSNNYFIMYEGKANHTIGNDIIKGVGPTEESAWDKAIAQQDMEDEDGYHPYSWVDC
jgi:hypothetical protein